MRVLPSHVVTAASQQMQCAPDMIRGRSKASYEARVRRFVYYAGRELGLSTTEIARYVNRDHSTVCQMTNKKSLNAHERALVNSIKERALKIAVDHDARIIDLLKNVQRRSST